MAKLVVLYINDKEGDFNQGFPVSLRIRAGNQLLGQKVDAFLPPKPELLEHYRLWQSLYLNLVSSLQSSRRITPRQATNVCIPEIINACEQLKSSMNNWLNSWEFMPIIHRLEEKLSNSDEILFIVNTKYLFLQRLPWHCWDFFEHYSQAEVALSFPVRQCKFVIRKDRVKILAVFGNNQTLGNQTKIGIDKDWELLQKHLPDAEFLPAMQEPTLEELHDQLWEQNPDIFYYGGHSSIEADGRTTTINIRHDEKIQINDLIKALKKAGERGLQLAIFNSCEGLGIARQLADSFISQVIVMREPVPDEVAQRFLQYFLRAFAEGRPLHIAVREAKERMGYLEGKYPGATLLPMIFQNPAELPYTWRQIRGVPNSTKQNQGEQVYKESCTSNQTDKGQLPNRDDNLNNPQQQKGSSVILPLCIYCPACGVQNLSVTKFCHQCGFNFTHTPQSSLRKEQDLFIICPACDCPNSRGTTQCDACYTPLTQNSTVIEATDIGTIQTQMSPESSHNQNKAIASTVIEAADIEPIQTQMLPESSHNQNKAIASTVINKVLGGRYQILQELGRGAFGVTFVAEDMQRPRNPQCVVKQFKPHATDPTTLRLGRLFFDQEAEILEQLATHDQIPRLLAHFEQNQEFYIIQEYIEGHDLSKEIFPGKKQSETYTIKLLQDILEVLAFVHQHNTIHRDIKPSNIRRRLEDGKIVLIDFGAVKQISNQVVNPQGQTSFTVAIGTYGYMPSEQANCNPKLGSDIYAVGIIGIYALTGIAPLNLQKDSQTGEIVWRNQAIVSPHLADILDKMVRYDFRQRYQSATDALQALENMYRISVHPCSPKPTILSRLKSLLKGLRF